MLDSQRDRQSIWNMAGQLETVIQAHLFGQLSVHTPSGDISLDGLGEDGDRLLRWLLLHLGEPNRGETIARALWPQLSLSHRRNTFHHAVSSLTEWLTLHLGGESRLVFLRPTSSHICLSADSVWTDHQQFLYHEEQAETAVSNRDAPLRRAHCEAMVDLFRGSLLEENRYDEWVLAERWRLHDLYLVALARLASLAFQRQAYFECVTYCRALIDEDPLGEGMHRLLMRCYHRLGYPSLAIRHYHRLRSMLWRKASTEPVAETRRLYNDLSP